MYRDMVATMSRMRWLAPGLDARRTIAIAVLVGLVPFSTAAAQPRSGEESLTLQVVPEPVLSAVRATDLSTPGSGGEESVHGLVITRFFLFADGTSEEDLRVTVEGAPSQCALAIEIDGAAVGRIVTDAEGEGTLFLSTHPSPGGHHLPASLMPVTAVRRVSVRGEGLDAQGDLSRARHRERLYASERLLGD